VYIAIFSTKIARIRTRNEISKKHKPKPTYMNENGLDQAWGGLWSKENGLKELDTVYKSVLFTKTPLSSTLSLSADSKTHTLSH
jgi:hypothetical protein